MQTSSTRRQMLLAALGAGAFDAPIVEEHFAVGAEIGASATRSRIDRDQPGIDGRLEQSPATGSAARTFAIEPRRQAAVDQPVARMPAHVDLRIESPALPAADGIERDNPVERRGEEQSAVDE